MTGYVIQPGALAQLDAIHDHWGQAQAERNLKGLFATFDAITRGELYWHRVISPKGIDGFQRRYQRHVIYWRGVPGAIDVVAILHERMKIADRLAFAFDQRRP